MSNELMIYILGVVGFFGTCALTINAFFLKGIYMDLNEVKIKLAEIFARSDAKEMRITHLEDQVEKLQEKLHNLEIGE